MTSGGRTLCQGTFGISQAVMVNFDQIKEENGLTVKASLKHFTKLHVLSYGACQLPQLSPPRSEASASQDMRDSTSRISGLIHKVIVYWNHSAHKAYTFVYRSKY